MGTEFIATAAPEVFTNQDHLVEIENNKGQLTFVSPNLPQPGDPVAAMESIAEAGDPKGVLQTFFGVFPDNSVNYSQSNAAVFIDLEQPVQHGGFAEGDMLGSDANLSTIFKITGSAFNDVIRGSNEVGTGGDIATFGTNSGDNVLIGGAGDDVLEGRGGADDLIGVLEDGEAMDRLRHRLTPARRNRSDGSRRQAHRQAPKPSPALRPYSCGQLRRSVAKLVRNNYPTNAAHRSRVAPRKFGGAKRVSKLTQ
jgi:Ca2+-binding RTX toxin-like protein